MSDKVTDMGYLMDPSLYATKAGNWWELPSDTGLKTSEKDNSSLTFEDMLMLMVTQLQNQTIDNQADTNDMMNQMIQMTVMQAVTEMTAQVKDLTDANVMSYSASLVGKEVTVGVIDSRTGKLTNEVVGVVTATGVYNGQQVIFLGDQYYPLSSIMAVGRLPEEAVDGTKPTVPDETEDGEKVDGGDETENGGQVEGGEETGESTEPPVDATEDETESIEENGADAAPQSLPVEDYYGENGMDAVAAASGISQA